MNLESIFSRDATIAFLCARLSDAFDIDRSVVI